MRVLLDESVAQQLAPLLTGHFVSTVPREGWAGVNDAELLLRASARFDALITGDQGFQHQQNLSVVDLGLLVLAMPDNRVATITGLRSRILEALNRLEPGQVIRITARGS